MALPIAGLSLGFCTLFATMVLWPHAYSLAALLIAYTPSIQAATLPVRDSTSNGLLVDTSVGKVQGFYNNTQQTVRAFLGVPYAAAPSGSRRFLPPATRAKSSSTIKATAWPAACPGIYPNATTIYSILPYLPFTPEDEDCLTFNIWAPSAARMKKLGNKPLPVVMYFYGGSWTQGATSISTYEATNLVENHDVVVAMPNYRVSIFGSPNSPYLYNKGGAQNVGLLDQRFAIKWLQKNVHAFGGDSKRMIAFGQSAGSGSLDLYGFAYPKDPILTGTGLLSASSLLPVYNNELPQGNFTDLANNVGCTGSNDEKIFKCMQQVPFATLTSFINNHPEKGYLFRLTVDNITVFTDQLERISSGRVAKIPQFGGQLDDEGTSLVAFSPDGIDQAAADVFTNAIIKCPASREDKARVDAGLTTYRYRYSGVYPNLSPYSFLGAYHTSDVPMWLGSVNVVPGLKEQTTSEQKKQSAYMQGAVVAFAYDPKDGLAKYGWPKYQAEKGKTLVHLDPRNSAEVVVFENPAEFDAPCTST
ncbi:carbohydrate esterase family 10 protein [Ceratobasidium sp. AG-Ba]|nr:carbohydrate esterase family 10 protein [Ceratobasidium sp. AG-Ba]QRW09369.1 carbohydrate esterase family 10 protein [Ceratobasidium sp. AG-Ba]